MKRRICDLRPLFEEQRAFVLDECLTCCGVVAEPWWQICRLVSQIRALYPLWIARASVPREYGGRGHPIGLPAKQERLQYPRIVRKLNGYLRIHYWRRDCKSIATNIKNAIRQNFGLKTRARYSAIHHRIVFIIDDIVDCAFPLYISNRKKVAIVGENERKIERVFRIGGGR